MRIVVMGTSGAGKTTLARTLAARLAMPHMELDAVNWQPGWRDLNTHDRTEFIRCVAGAIEAEEWVADGNYGSVRDMLWRRATHLVWLDYNRPVIMLRVIARSLYRAITRQEIWAGTGNRERLRDFVQPYHPVRWAWSTWYRLREETEARVKQSEYSHLTVFRLRHPRETARAIEALVRARIRG